MSLEIERKFLVKDTSFIEKSYQKNFIKQGFLNSNKNRVVRVRVLDNKSFLTIKGVSNSTGTTRYEWENEISLLEGEQLLLLCEKKIIEKHRYLIKNKMHTFEVDVFLNENKGLIIAEIELNSEGEKFEKPSWLGDEVTGQIKYYNSSLSKNSFKEWL
jgi:CYTH domain-containing protein